MTANPRVGTRHAAPGPAGGAGDAPVSLNASPRGPGLGHLGTTRALQPRWAPGTPDRAQAGRCGRGGAPGSPRRPRVLPVLPCAGCRPRGDRGWTPAGPSARSPPRRGTASAALAPGCALPSGTQTVPARHSGDRRPPGGPARALGPCPSPRPQTPASTAAAIPSSHPSLTLQGRFWVAQPRNDVTFVTRFVPGRGRAP